jgi:hypothetical protein
MNDAFFLLRSEVHDTLIQTLVILNLCRMISTSAQEVFVLNRSEISRLMASSEMLASWIDLTWMKSTIWGVDLAGRSRAAGGGMRCLVSLIRIVCEHLIERFGSVID